MKKDVTDQSYSRQLVIIGAGGHAVSVANVALSAGYQIKYFVDKNKKGLSLLNYNIIEKIDEIKNMDQYSFAIAVGDNSLREKIYKELVLIRPNILFPPIIHATAVISFFTQIGEGSIIMPQAVIGPNSKVGKFCLVNTLASIDHDCTMSDYSSIAPSASTGGNVTIGLRSAVSIGATIKHGLTIGNDSIVGANSYLNKNLANNLIVYGTPAKIIRKRTKGEAYLK